MSGAAGSGPRMDVGTMFPGGDLPTGYFPGGRTGGSGPITRPDQRGNGGGGNGGGGGGGNNGGGGGGGFNYHRLIKRLGMPLDPMFDAQRTSLENSLASQLQELRGAFNVGNAKLNEQDILGTERVGEDFNERGIFGSGLHNLGQQRFDNQIAEQQLGLRSMFDQGRFGAKQDYRQGMQEALLALAARLQGQRGLPLPTRGPWGRNA